MKWLLSCTLTVVFWTPGAHYAQKNETHFIEHFGRYMDPGLKSSHSIVGTRVDAIPVYSSDFSFFAGAATFELFTILIVLYTFYGWWRLGRDM